jgi:excisionase family DNA binding protein
METALLERLDRIEQLIKTHILTKQDWLTVQQFAECIGLNSKYVSELCKTGKIMAARSTERHGRNFTWRIRREELERYQREGQMTD